MTMVGRLAPLAAALVCLALPLGALPSAERPAAAVAGGGASPASPSSPAMTGMIAPGQESAVLAGGCFWGIEGVFERLAGVVDVASGYAGGKAQTAHYEMVGTGTTGHAESVRIVYDPSRVSYATLLKVFFTVAHDPTELNYQGPDTGPQYRSAIFYSSDEQKRVAEETIRGLEKDKVFRSPIVTEVTRLDQFYPAEDYHQDFMRLNPTYPYILYWDAPKVADLEKKYPDLLARR
jgi:peptide-methionine (S)-S-oxide reductase